MFSVDGDCFGKQCPLSLHTFYDSHQPTKKMGSVLKGFTVYTSSLVSSVSRCAIGFGIVSRIEVFLFIFEHGSFCLDFIKFTVSS